MIVDDTSPGDLATRGRLDTRRATRHIPGEQGWWIFILGDMTVFALLFGAYVQARSRDPAFFNTAQQSLNQSFGAINTVLLLCSSLLVVTGIRAVRIGACNIARSTFVGAFCFGLGFIFIKFLEWSHHIGVDQTPATNDFWLYYYLVTGLHLFHLLIGMGLLVFIITQARRQPLVGTRRFIVVEGGACYWHMVDLLWVVIFPLFYLVS